MTLVAVDAGIAIKWYVPEIHHAEARRLLDGSFTLQAPDLIAAEFTNIVWKKHLLRNELTLSARFTTEQPKTLNHRATVFFVNQKLH